MRSASLKEEKLHTFNKSSQGKQDSWATSFEYVAAKQVVANHHNAYCDFENAPRSGLVEADRSAVVARLFGKRTVRHARGTKLKSVTKRVLKKGKRKSRGRKDHKEEATV